MAEDRTEAIAALAAELLAIPSPTGAEAEIAALLERRLADLQPHALVRAGNSLLAAVRPPQLGRKTVLLLGHTDTVPALDDNRVRRDGDRLYGLGASDMKAGVALIVDLLEQARGLALRHNVVAALYAAEESSYARNELPLLRAAARDWFDRVDLAVCLEPTDNRLELGCLGTAHAEVTFHGKAAHSARPWQGDNAIHKAAGLLGRLAARPPRRRDAHGLGFVEVASATTAASRGARNVIPDRFTVNVNYRFAPGADEAAVRRELEALVQGEGDIAIADYCPAGRVCADNPLLRELEAVLPVAERRAKQAWTDVGRLSEWGIDAVNFGPGATAQAHQAGEWVAVSEVGRAARALRAWLLVE